MSRLYKAHPYLSLRFVWLHQLHYLSLLYQDDLGVSKPGNMQGCSCDEHTHTCGTALQPLQGEESRVRLRGTEGEVELTRRYPPAGRRDQVMVTLDRESMSYRTPFIPNFGTGRMICGGGKQTDDVGN